MTGKIHLHSRIDGPEGAPWIVLSNSLGSNHRMWEAQMPLLTRKYRVLRYDHRGHGASDVPPGPYSFDQFVGDVIDLMDEHGIERADWMGLSMGAMTGMGLALAHGDRFGRMVLADARADAPEAFRTMWDTRIAAVQAGGTEAIADATLGMWLSADWRASHPDEAQGIRDMVTATDTDGYVACCQALQHLDYLRHLGAVTNPVLYIGGSDDKAAAPEVMRAMAATTPGATYVEIPGSGHVANIDGAEAFNTAIAAFLEID